MEPILIYDLAAWLRQANTAALESCDDAMMVPGFQPTSTREILEAGYRLYHATERNPEPVHVGPPDQSGE